MPTETDPDTVGITVRIPRATLARIDDEGRRRVVGRGPLIAHLLDVGLEHLAPWPPEPAHAVHPDPPSGIDFPDLSGVPAPLCTCGHRYDRHDHTEPSTHPCYECRACLGYQP